MQVMVTLVNKYSDSLRCQSPDLAILSQIRDIFAEDDEDDRNIRLQLQSDEAFLCNLVEKLGSSDISLEVAIGIVEILYMALFSQVPATGDFVVKWLKLMLSTTFLSNCRTCNSQASMRPSTLYSLLLLVSIEITEAARSVPLNADTLGSDIYLSSCDTVIEVHDLIMALSANRESCATLYMSWGMFLHRLLLKLGEGESYDSGYTKLVDHVFAGDAKEPHRYLIELAVGSHLLQELTSILQALPSNHQDLYCSVLLSFFLEAQVYLQASEATAFFLASLIKSRALANAAWQNHLTRPVLDVVRQQFPHSPKPFLRLIRALAHSGTRTIQYLESLPTYTQTLPIGFSGFEVVPDEAGGKTVVELTEPLDLFLGTDQHGGITIPIGSRGLMFSVPRSSPIVLWQHSYSAVHYLARILQTSILGLGATLHHEIIQEVLGAFCSLITSSDEVDEFLQNVADEINEPLPQMIFDICEQAIQSRECSRLLIESIAFFKALFRVNSELTWAYVGRLSLFQPSNRLAERVLSTEPDRDTYLLLTSICQLVSAAVSALVAGALHSDIRLERTKSQFLSDAIKSLFSLYETYLDWPLSNTHESLLLGADINSLFRQIMDLTLENRLDETPLTRPARDVITNAAMLLTNFFNDTKTTAVVRLANLDTAINFCLAGHGELEFSTQRFVIAVFDFFGSLLSFDHDGLHNLVALRKLCFIKFINNVRILDVDSTCRTALTRCFLTILETNGSPLPSILAQLGPEKRTLKSILLRRLDKVYESKESEANPLWQLIRVLLHPSQEGFALYMLSHDAEDPNDSLIHFLRLHIAGVDQENWSARELSQILALLAAAQNWPTLVHRELISNAEVWSKLRSLFMLSQKLVVSQKDEALLATNAYRMVCNGLLARIMAADLNATDNVDRKSSEEDLLVILQQMSAQSLAIGHYRASLHGNLSRNVSQKYVGFALHALSRKWPHCSCYGESFFYNFALAEQMIPANSFLRELRTANFNLSLIDAQAQRLRGCLLLIISLSLPIITSAKIWDCLKGLVLILSGLRDDSSIPILPEIELERTSTIALLINSLQSSAVACERQEECLILLDCLAQQLISQMSPTTQAITLTRSMLRSICELLSRVALVSVPKSRLLALQRTLSTIFNLAVCQFGANQLNDFRSSRREDVVQDLLVMITLGNDLARILQKWDMSRAPFAGDLMQSNLINNLVDMFASSNESNTNSQSSFNATTAMQMLIMILDVTKAANQLMHCGIMRAITESAVCLRLQKSAALSQSDPALYTLWLHGILPLVLNLATCLGGRMKDEIATFVTSYAKQIEANFASWSGPSVITKAQTEEFLLLLFLIGIYDVSQEPSEKGFGETRQYLYERIEYLLSHPRTTTALISPSEDEEPVLDNLKSISKFLNIDG